MKMRNYSIVMLLLSLAFFCNQVFGQSRITELLKTKPAVIEKTRPQMYKNSQIKFYEYTMANGLKVVIRADDSRKDIQMSAICPGGASLVDDQDFQSAIHAGAIIGNSGLGDFSGSEISQFFKQKNISLTPDIEENYSTLKGSCMPADLETFLQAIYLYFTHPKKDKVYFDTYIKNLSKSAAIYYKNPYNVLQDTVNALVKTNKNRVNTLSAANIKAINLDKAFDIFSKCFGSIKGYTFVFTGNFKVDDFNEPSNEVIDLMAQYFNALPSKAAMQAQVDRNNEIPNGKIYKKVYNGHLPLAAVQLVYSGKYQHSDSVNLQLKVLSYLLEKNLDTLKAFSGASKASVTLTLTKFPKQSYSINIGFKCLPQQVDELLAMVNRTIADLKQGVKPEQLKQYVTLRKSELKKQTFDYIFWRDYLALQYVNGDDPYEIVHYPYYFYKASTETVKQAANEFLTGSNYIQAVLLPAPKK
ncbi:Peptidase M16 inactive domain protein [compost metagenome]